MPDLSQALQLLACLAFLAVFAGLVGLMLHYERRAKQEKRARAVAMGFQPVEQPDPDLMKQLYALHARRDRRLEARNLFHRRAADYDVYLFDLWNIGNDSDELMDNGVLIRSPHLRLPRLMLYSKIEGSGFLTEAANKLVTRVMAGQNRLDFPAEPTFEHKFWVTSPEEPAARAFLTPDLLRRMDSLKNVHIEAGGELFTLASTIPGGYDRKSQVSPEQALAQTIQDAERVARWWMV